MRFGHFLTVSRLGGLKLRKVCQYRDCLLKRLQGFVVLSQHVVDVSHARIGQRCAVPHRWIVALLFQEVLVESQSVLQQLAADLLHVWHIIQLCRDAREHAVHSLAGFLEICLRSLPLIGFGAGIEAGPPPLP